MSFVSTLVLVLTTQGGLLLIMDQDRPEPTFNADAIGTGLVVMNSVVVVAQLIYIVLVKAKMWNNIASRCSLCLLQRPRSGKAKILPERQPSQSVEDKRVDNRAFWG